MDDLQDDGWTCLFMIGLVLGIPLGSYLIMFFMAFLANELPK